MFIKEAYLASFADDNTIYVLSNDIKIKINLSEKEIEIAIIIWRKSYKLREKCPDTEFFPVHIFLHSD